MAESSGKDRVLAAGHRLDGYELLLPVGEGGMASVWVARLMRKHGFEKLVAIKTILPKFAEDETFQKMFLDEARIASRIDHTNVAHIHDLGETNGILYIVMEYVDGDALTRLRKVLLKRRIDFPVGIALRVMSDVCAGLHAAHELKGLDGRALGVVHRDVSPQNVLITAEGVSKLIDFGVAKAEQRLTEETHTGFVKGKVQYMAPEQALGKNIDRRADVWSVGAVIFHLIAGKPPFEADNQLALLAMLQGGRAAPPLPPSIPPIVQDIVRKALSHNLQQRFQSAMEMKAAIEKTGLVASQEAVGAFMREHLGEFAERRKSSLSMALHQVDQLQSARQVTNPDVVAPSVSTQRIAPENLPRPPGQAYQAPPSDSRIGPATPRSLQAHPSPASLRAEDPRRMTAPLGTLPPGAVAPNHLPFVKQTLAHQNTQQLAPNARPPSAATYGTTGTGPRIPNEPPSSPEAVDAHTAAAENTNGGGSLGLASVSTSMPIKSGGLSWLVIGAISLMCVLAAVGIGLGVRGLGQKKVDPHFSTMPSAASALPPASVTATPTPAPTPPPTPAPTPEPTPSETASAHPIGAHPPVVNPGVRPVPAPTASQKKRPKVDDGF